MSIRALLLDLDDTLLINNIEVFFPAYYSALAHRFEGILPAKTLLDALSAGTRAMMSNPGTGELNSEVFWREFTPRCGRPREEMEPLFRSFYETVFEELAELTAVDPAARELIVEAKARGLKLAIATQPVFPLEAVLARLRWADIPDEEFHFDFVSTYDGLMACKPHPTFFTTVLQALGVEASEAVMVGDSISSDMAASGVGMRTFWLTRAGGEAPEANWSGDLNHLSELVAAGGLDDGE